MKLGAQPKPTKYIKWNFRQASPESLDDVNMAIEQQIGGTVGTNSTDMWEDLSRIYLAAIDRHILRRAAKPSKPWISENTLQLLERRGRLRTQGDCCSSCSA